MQKSGVNGSNKFILSGGHRGDIDRHMETQKKKNWTELQEDIEHPLVFIFYNTFNLQQNVYFSEEIVSIAH